MTQSDRIENELKYVRELVSKSEVGPAPSAIYFLWAAICLVGFPLADFAPQYVQFYWPVAAPLGAIASAILGWRHKAKMGQLSRDVGIRHGLHWWSTMAAVFLTVPLGITGAVAWHDVHRVMLLILALSYFLAGVYLDRPMMWVGVLVAFAYVALFFIHTYEWTVVGVVIALGFVVTGILGGRKRVEATD